jgi:hypothetical protein
MPRPTPALSDLVTVSGTLGEVRIQTVRGSRERITITLQQQPWSFAYGSEWPQYTALRSLAGRTGQVTIWTTPRELNAGGPVRIWQLSLDGQTIVDYQHTAPAFAAADRAAQWGTLFAVLYPVQFAGLAGVVLLVVWYSHDAAYWHTTLDGQPTDIAVRFHPLNGPSVLVDGVAVEAQQVPTWRRDPTAARRTYAFQVRGHAATIVEARPVRYGANYAHFSLELDGRSYPSPGPYSASWLWRSKR